MSKTMIDVLIAIARRSAAGNPCYQAEVAFSTRQALYRRKLIDRRWQGNDKTGRWSLRPTRLGLGVVRAYDLGFGRGLIRQRSDAREQIGEIDYEALGEREAASI